MEDIKSKTAIECRGVPEEYNNKTFMRNHFRKYGIVKRVIANPDKQSTIIHFESHDQADDALKNGNILGHDIPPMQIFWRARTLKTQKHRVTRELKRNVRVSKSLELETADPSFSRSEVDEELASMRGVSDIQSAIQIKKLVESKSSEQFGAGRKGKEKTSEKEKTLGGASEVTPSTSKQDVIPSHSKILSSVGCTAEDCFEILNNRDKMLKTTLGMPKLTGDALDTAIKGTCPDMCPEKERYMREHRRHLSVYEIIPGTDLPGQQPQVDHGRAVKEYSRSSADQDMPLPNELRPPHVLQMTMDYLISDIMELGGDGKWDVWYEFMWNRTRSIRKDITQQQLCDMTAVSVIEKIVRFHIYCAERLCEEDVSCFDQKINNENMTKCLQTLKEMYHDLDKKGIKCPNEAEFRAYMVLMNLNEGDTLREVQQLKMELRLSEPVCFATAVHSAINTNNYVRFFKLVHHAPFLSSCILHRYFTQVRTKALQIIVRVYRGAGPIAEYPLMGLVHLLAFEDISEAAGFCEHHGLTVTNDHVAMDKSRFIFPETALENNRAINIIESKLITSVGEAINGGPLPKKAIYKPVLSFDNNGRFIGQINEAFQQTTNIKGDKPAETTASKVLDTRPYEMKDSTTAPVEMYSMEAIKEVAKDMFIEVIKEQVLLISKTLRQGIQIYLSNDSVVYEELQNIVINNEIKQLCSDIYNECKQAEMESAARKKAEISYLQSTATCAIADVMTNTTVMEMCQNIAEAEISEVLHILAQDRQRRVTSDLASTLLDVTIQEEICLVAEDVFESDVIRRQQLLESAQHETQLIFKARFFKQWRNKYAARIRLKCSIQTFPSGPSLLPLSIQVKSILPNSHGISNSNLHLGNNALATLDSSTGVLEKEARFHADILSQNKKQSERRERAWTPFNLGDGLFEKLTARVDKDKKNISGDTLYWKLVLSLPDVGPDSSLDDEYAQKTINTCDWLRSKFKKGTVPVSDPESNTELIALYTTQVSDSIIAKGNLGICVRLLKGFPEDEECNTIDRHHMLGTSAIMLYVGDVGPDDKEFYLGEVQSRLQHVLESLPKSPPVPLIVLTSPNSPVICESDLNLGVFVEEGMISHYSLLTITNVEDESCNKEVYYSLLWAAKHNPTPPCLISETLRDAVENTIQQEYMLPVYQTMSEKLQFHHMQSQPQLLVALYNDIIGHVADAVTQDLLQDLSWPVAEFSSFVPNLPSAEWNTSYHLLSIRQRLLDLQLPTCNMSPDGSVDWTDMVDDVWEYVSDVTEDEENNTQLLSRVKWLLRKAEHKFFSTSNPHKKTQMSVDQHVYIPWTDVIHACIDSRLSQADWSNEQGEELMVHYLPSTLRAYTPIKEWMEYLLDIKKGKQSLLIHGTPERVKKRKYNSIDFAAPKVQKFHFEISPKPEKHLDAMHDLHNMIAAEKQNNSFYEENLQRCLLNNDTIEPGTPIQRLKDAHEIGISVDENFRSPKFATPRWQEHKLFSSSPKTPLCPILKGIDVPSKNSHHSLEADISDLNLSLDSLKQSDTIYEMRLRAFLTNP